MARKKKNSNGKPKYQPMSDLPPDDVSLVQGKDKSLHDWQQDETEAEMLVNYFSEPNDLVCDPLAGSFTSAIASRRNGRKFVGCDVETECVEIGITRLEEEMGAKKRKRGKRKG